MGDSVNSLQDSIKNLPSNPGVYKYFDKRGGLLYIGKAKNLKKRVQSYFNKEHESFRLKLLVQKIYSLEYIVVGSEQDALLLENNLIKEFQPRYNVQLKDDKTFPWICIKNENFPRIFSTRNRMDDGSIYFGPFTSAHMVRTLLDLIRKIYPLRSCSLHLSAANIMAKKFRTCLEFQIDNCKGPCEGLQSEDEYNGIIDQIKKIIRGNLSEVIYYLKDLMKTYAGNLQFEEAEKVKTKLEVLERFQSKSTIVNPDIKDLDVYSILNTEKYAVVNYLKVLNGAIVQSHNVKLNKKLDESADELLLFAIMDIQQKIPTEAKEIIVSENVDASFINKTISIPKIGDKKKLIDLSLHNALQFKFDIEKQKTKNEESSLQNKLMEQAKVDLRLNEWPVHIECFDNSNLQGTNAVSACVVFKNGKPLKSEYRIFNVKSVTGPDDYATMQEVVERRYRRLIKEGKSLPQLVIIDGGKGQLSMAYQIFKKLKIENKVQLIGIAKRLEEIFFPNDSVPLYLDKNSMTLKMIQHARNEAHRFGISRHRNKRDKNMTNSVLDEIKGIGDKTKTLLLSSFTSIDEIRNAGESRLQDLLGKSKAKIVYKFFNY